MSREKVEWALQEEKKLKEANLIRPELTTKLRDGVCGFVGSLVGMQIPQAETYELMNLVSGVIGGQFIPLSVHINDGQLIQVTITDAKPENIEFAKPLYTLQKEQDGALLIPNYPRHDDWPSVGGPMIDRLFEFVSKTLDVQMEHKSRTFSENFLKGEDPVDKLERFLAEANEDKLNFIAKNIDCYSSIKNEIKDRFNDADRILNKFDEMIGEMYWNGGKISAKDLIRLYEWKESGEMINVYKTRILIDQVIKQYEQGVSPTEIDKYKRYSAIITAMNDKSSSARNVFFANKQAINVADIQDVNETLELNFGVRKQHYADWVQISSDAVWMANLVNNNPNMSPVDLMIVVAGNLNKDKVSIYPMEHVPKGNITNQFELTTLLDLIQDDELRKETVRIGIKSCEIVKEMANSNCDIRGVFRQFDELSFVDKFIQTQIFNNIKHSGIEEKYDLYKKGKEFEKLLEDGVLPAVAAKRSGIEKKDTNYLVYQYPILGKVKFEPKTRDLEP